VASVDEFARYDLRASLPQLGCSRGRRGLDFPLRAIAIGGHHRAAKS
jgi:hypothetical protein